MIDQVKSWGFVIQRYFLSLCHYVSFYIKRLGLLTASSSSSRIDSGEFSVNGQVDASRLKFDSDSDKRQTSSSSAIKLKPSSDIPGVKCVPFFGTIFEFNKFGSRRIHELAVERHAKFGDIFREKFFSQELVFVASTDLLKQWMAQEGKSPTSLKQDPSLVFKECCPYLKRGLFFRNGEEWSRLRKLGHNIVHRNAADFETFGLFNACEDFMGTLMQQLEKDGSIQDVETKSYEIAVGALLRIVFGENASKLEEYTGTDYITMSKNAKELNECHQQLLEMPVRVAKWLGSSAWTGYATKLHHNLTNCIKFSQLCREEILKAQEKASMSSHGLLYKTIPLNAPIQDVDDLLTDFAVDTKDPFAGTVMFVTQVLGMYPKIQEKIFEEVCQIYPNNEPITYQKVNLLEYTEAFFKEVLRLYPVAAFTARVALEDTVLGEYHIKPGTMIMYSSYVAQRDPRYFSRPTEVLPERWLPNKDPSITCDANAFASFGLKARVCIGQQLAISIFLLYIANLMRNFKLTSADLGEVAMRTVLYPVNQKPIQLEKRRLPQK